VGRMIYGQVIASTGPDLHGERLDPQTIRTLFSQIERAWIGGVEHDIASRPAAKASNFRLQDTSDGGLKILADIEVLDENTFARMGGFSISFTRTTVRMGRAKMPAARVLVNPRQFDFDEMAELGKELDLRGYTLDVTERIEKAAVLETAVIVVVMNIVLKIADGFLSAVGADLYKALRSRKRKDNPSAPVKLLLELQQPVRCILDVDPAVSPKEFARLEEFLPLELPASIPSKRIARIVGHVRPGPSVTLAFAVLDDGTCLDLGGAHGSGATGSSTAGPDSSA